MTASGEQGADSLCPMGIRGFERRLERMVEGAFARAFKSGLRPVELGRRLVREMDDNRSVGVRGGTVVPNSFTVVPVPQRPRAVRGGAGQPLPASCATPPASTPGTRATRFMGPVEVELVADERLHTGAFQIVGRLREGRRRRRGRVHRAAHRRPVHPHRARHHASAATPTPTSCWPTPTSAATTPRSGPRATASPWSTSARPTAPGSTGCGWTSRCWRTATSSPSGTPACASRQLILTGDRRRPSSHPAR